VYAIAGLADDWEENRQTCVDVLCAYLRMPYEPDPGPDAPERERLAFQASREVRHTVIRVITAHLKDYAAVSWRGRNFDFTGVVFDGGDFSGARFSGGTVSFQGVKFPGGTIDFQGVEFPGGTIDFQGAEFSGGMVDFGLAKFSGAEKPEVESGQVIRPLAESHRDDADLPAGTSRSMSSGPARNPVSPPAA
jgi:Pentapeptide repeats (9 copies)